MTDFRVDNAYLVPPADIETAEVMVRVRICGLSPDGWHRFRLVGKIIYYMDGPGRAVYVSECVLCGWPDTGTP